MGYTWNKELETGNYAIDAQHRQLIDAFNDFTDTCARNDSPAAVTKTLDFLTDYTVKATPHRASGAAARVFRYCQGARNS